jgi:hypothetical protein
LKYKVLYPIFVSQSNNRQMTLANKRLFGILLAVGLLLLLPLVAMQFTSEVDWSASDFLIMGTLLLGTGLGCELVLRTVRKTEHRVLLVVGLLLLFLLIWAELAVGVFGTPFAGS